ncbi:hypothetical protein ATCC90586_011425 [Pythium insidiosum]|nr:hypothetical protein ATCC90586_011425 [Pythium insidiosum]
MQSIMDDVGFAENCEIFVLIGMKPEQACSKPQCTEYLRTVLDKFFPKCQNPDNSTPYGIWEDALKKCKSAPAPASTTAAPAPAPTTAAPAPTATPALRTEAPTTPMVSTIMPAQKKDAAAGSQAQDGSKATPDAVGADDKSVTKAPAAQPKTPAPTKSSASSSAVVAAAASVIAAAASALLL